MVVVWWGCCGCYVGLGAVTVVAYMRLGNFACSGHVLLLRGCCGWGGGAVHAVRVLYKALDLFWFCVGVIAWYAVL
jgi:hypothetical protein